MIRNWLKQNAAAVLLVAGALACGSLVRPSAGCTSCVLPTPGVWVSSAAMGQPGEAATSERGSAERAVPAATAVVNPQP